MKHKMLHIIHNYTIFVENNQQNEIKEKQRMLKIARNLVDYEAGKTILETALCIIQKSDIKQTSMFDE